MRIPLPLPLPLAARVLVVGILAGGLAAAASARTSPEPSSAPLATPSADPEAAGAPTPTPTADPAEVAANELGQVPVLMYHRILPDGGGEYDLTAEEFRAELTMLYEQGYRPVRVIDLVRGDIDIPAGTSPVVLTFDDSTREQFAYTPDGGIVPDTAIGILLDFAAQHPDFTPVASLYVNAHPFGGVAQGPAMLADLHARGFELGNHSHGHTNLSSVDADGVRRELAMGAKAITDVVPEAEVRTLSLPLGVWSEPRELAYEGQWDGTGYVHEGILLVGANPAPSPFAADFDPHAIPRIRSSPSWAGGEPDYGSRFWLESLQRHPERRYVSDGDAERISFPAALADQLHPAHAARANPY